MVRTDDNPTLNTAVKTDWVRWKLVVDKELKGIKDKDVYDEIKFEEIPVSERGNILKSKFVLNTKYLPTGEKEKDTARLCVLDCLSKEEPMTHTYAPTGNDKVFKVLLQLSVMFGWKRHKIDFVAAFLNAVLPEPRYMKLPDHFKDKEGKAVYWKLKKALYGMRESGFLFSETVKECLLRHGWIQCPSDPAVFMKFYDDGVDFGFLYTHVDDEHLFSSSDKVMELLLIDLSEFEVKRFDSVVAFIGYDCYQHNDGAVTLTMPNAIDKIKQINNDDNLQQADYRLAIYPMPMTYEVDIKKNEYLLVTDEQRGLFRTVLGQLMHIVKTHPEIMPACNKLSRRVPILNIRDLGAADRVVNYIHSRRNHGLTYTPGESRDVSLIELNGSCDATFDTEEGSLSVASYVAYIVKHPSAAVVARTLTMQTIHLSSCSSEMGALLLFVLEVIWLRDLLKDFRFEQKQPTVIKMDNMSTIILCTHYSGNHKRVKHILRAMNFLIEQVEAGTIVLEWVESENNTADVLSKVMMGGAFKRHRANINGPERAITDEMRKERDQ